MREHPIPQDVTGYKFHIVGNMTIKQFAEIFLGVIGAVIIYATNLPTVIKWPLMLVSFSFGAALAFLPIEERPLDHWVTTFFRILYKPTRFFWKKKEFIPYVFEYKSKKPQTDVKELYDLTPAKKERIKEYLSSVQLTQNGQDEWDEYQNQRINSILASFQDVKVQDVKIKKQVIKPQLKTRVRSLQSTALADQQENKKTLHKVASRVTQQIVKQKASQSKANQIISNLNKKEVEIFSRQADRQVNSQADRQTNNQTKNQAATSHKSSSPPAHRQETAKQEITNKPTRSTPLSPAQNLNNNIIQGQVINDRKQPLSKAIVEIRNHQNQVIRVLKTDAEGKFSHQEPLVNGNYSLTVEKTDYNFKKYHFHLTGTKIPPIYIKAV